MTQCQPNNVFDEFAKHGITLLITKKHVKNINFRMRLGECHVSAPHLTPDIVIMTAIHTRLSWAIKVNQTLKDRQLSSKHSLNTLWGNPATFTNESEMITHYRQALHAKIPLLLTKWQPVVGVCAREVRLKKMKTRWGTCNTRDRRVWLSTYLPAYPYECTEYVFVHELCHLIHPNHSPAFWREVKKAMPDYQTWHDLLRGKHKDID